MKCWKINIDYWKNTEHKKTVINNTKIIIKICENCGVKVVLFRKKGIDFKTQDDFPIEKERFLCNICKKINRRY